MPILLRALMLTCAAGIAPAEAPAVLLPNGDFEAHSDGLPEGWAWNGRDGAEVSWVADAGVGGSACIRIRTDQPGDDDAACSRELQLAPHSAYILRGKVIGKGADGEPCIENPKAKRIGGKTIRYCAGEFTSK